MLIVLIIAFITAIIINMYAGNLKLIERNFNEKNATSLNMIVQNIENQMEIIINIENQVVADKNFSKYILSKETGSIDNTLILQELINNMWSKAIPVKTLENLGIYLQKDDYMIFATGAEKKEYFFGRYIYEVRNSNEISDILKSGRRPEFFTRKVTYENSFKLIGIINNTYINLAMVQRGLAWWYPYYAPGARDLETAQENARAARLGLWSDHYPQNPLDWRRQNPR